MNTDNHEQDSQKSALVARGTVADSPTTASRTAPKVGNSTTTLLLLDGRSFLRSQEYGPELLALLEGDPRARILITPVVDTLVFQDNQGNVISKTDGIAVGKIIEVKFIDLPEQGDRRWLTERGATKFSHFFSRKPVVHNSQRSAAGNLPTSA